MVKKEKNLTKNSFISLCLNIFINLIDFLIIILLTKFLGSFEFGRYIFTISVIKFLGLPILIGYPNFILRKSSFLTSNKLIENNNLIFRNIYVVAIYIIFLFLIISLFYFFDQNFIRDKLNLLLFGIISIIPVLSINNSISAIISSSGREIKGQALEKLIPSIFFIGLILIFGSTYKFGNHSMSIFLFSASSILSLVFSLTQLKGLLSWTTVNTKNLLNKIFCEIKESTILVLFQIFVIFDSLLPLIILGLFETPEIVGNYKLAIYISGISSYAIVAINKIVQPRFAKSFRKNDFFQIQKIAINSNRFTTIYNFIISVFLIIIYKKFIVLFFGNEFLISKITFFIIILSPFINSIFGPLESIFNMTGNENVAFQWSGISLFIGLILYFLLIPIFGMNGAAISTLFVSLIRGFALWRTSFKLLKINSSYLLNEIFKF